MRWILAHHPVCAAYIFLYQLIKNRCIKARSLILETARYLHLGNVYCGMQTTKKDIYKRNQMATMKRIPQRPSRPSTPAAGLLLRRRMQQDSISSTYRHVHRATLGDSVSSSFAVRQSATVTSPSYFLPEVTCKKHTSLTSTTTHSTGESADKKTSTCDSEQSAINPPLSASSSSDPAVYTEEEMERRRNLEKCLTWVHSLPDKFSSMHIVQQTVFAASDS